MHMLGFYAYQSLFKSRLPLLPALLGRQEHFVERLLVLLDIQNVL